MKKKSGGRKTYQTTKTMFTVIWLSILLTKFVAQAQSNFFPFALDTTNGAEILQNNLTPFDQETLSAEFVNSGLGAAESGHFLETMYPVQDYAVFQGLDDTSMFGTSVSMGSQYAVVGANGYGKLSFNLTDQRTT